MLQDELTRFIRTTLNSADKVYELKDFTSVTILYFKVIFAVIDLILLKTQGKTPKDHTERFRMLQKTNMPLYEFLDSNFKIYRSTYSTIITKETCDKLKEDVKSIIKRYEIQI